MATDEQIPRDVTGKLSMLSELLDSIETERGALCDGLSTMQLALSETAGSLARFQDVFAPLDARARQAAEAARAAAQPVLGSLQPDLQELDETLEEIEQKLTEIGGAIDEITATGDSAISEIEQVADAWIDWQKERFAELKDGVDGFAAIIGDHAGELEKGAETLRDKVSAAVEKLDVLCEDLAEQIDESLANPLRELRDGIRESLDGLVERVVRDEVARRVEDVAEELVAELNQGLDRLIASLGEALDELASEIFQSTAHGESSRAVLEPAIGQMRAILNPVFQELDRIRGLASTVGISL